LDRILKNTWPQEICPTAGIESIRCACGWEIVYVNPEEMELMLGSLLRHLREHPEGQPQLTVETH
jgi:hypothetical protein